MLTFNLKKEWFDKIKSGEKTHEYREVKPYWEKRIMKILNKANGVQSIKFNGCDWYWVITSNDCYCAFRCGYVGEKIRAKIFSITITNGIFTDLKINKPVYDIEFELVG